MHDNLRSWVEISRTAFRHNIAQLALLNAGQQIAVVVKSNAYGHGLLEIAQLCCEHEEVFFVCVAFLSEALSLRASGFAKPIIVMSLIDGDLAQAAHKDIHFFVSSMRQLKRFEDAGSIAGSVFDLHLKVDTGLARFGISPEEVVLFAQAIGGCKHVRFVGLCTHFAKAQACDDPCTNKQHACLMAIRDQLVRVGLRPAYIHCSNSAGALRGFQGYTLARIGAAAYGLWPSPDLQQVTTKQKMDFSLKPVLSWKTRVAELRYLPAGTSVGYNHLFQTTRQTTIAILPIGYADGYHKYFFSNGHVFIGDILAPIVGSIAMNTVTVDVTDLSEVQLGTEVTLVGLQSQVSAHAVAERAGCNVREVTTLISPLLLRRIVP